MSHVDREMPQLLVTYNNIGSNEIFFPFLFQINTTKCCGNCDSLSIFNLQQNTSLFNLFYSLFYFTSLLKLVDFNTTSQAHQLVITPEQHLSFYLQYHWNQPQGSCLWIQPLSSHISRLPPHLTLQVFTASSYLEEVTCKDTMHYTVYREIYVPALFFALVASGGI